MVAPLTSKMISDLDGSNEAHRRAGIGTLLGRLAPAGYVFYVDGNLGDDDNDGSSWGSSFQTLAVALAASNTAIGSGEFGWTSRNRIYAKGDDFTEDLVLLSQKTNVIGVGSFDQWSKPALIGNHIPVGTTCGLGTHFYNFHMKAPAAGGDIWTLGSAVSSFGLYNCTVDAQSTTAATGGVVATASPFLQLHGNEFVGKFSDAVIEMATGSARGTYISGNYIEGANNGIETAAGTTDGSGATERYIRIEDNTIITTAIGINDVADIAYIKNNNVFTGNAKGTTGFGAIQGNLQRGQGNRITTSDANNVEWPALGAL